MNTPKKKFHRDFIEEIKQRVDIVEIVSSYVTLKKAGKEFLGCCPFHNESTPSFTVTPHKNLAYCFGCSWGGNAIKFLMEIGRVSFADAVLDLARSTNIPVRYSDGSSEYDYPDPLPRPLTPKAPAAKEEQKPKKDYTVDEWRVNRSVERLLSGIGDAAKALGWLQQRGISREMVKHYRLGLEKRVVRPKESRPDYKEEYSSVAIFIPVPDRPGRFYVKKRVSPWLSDDERPNYLDKWSQFGLPATIYFTHNPPDACATWFGEGEWDAILLGELARQREEKVAVCCSTSGASIVPKASELEKLSGQITILYDRDEAGEKGAQKIAAALRGRGRIALVPMPDNCQTKGWDISDAIQAGYAWEDFKLWAEREEIGKSVKSASPKIPPQLISIPNQPTSKIKSQKPGNLQLSKINQESYSSPQSTIFDISNPPLIASFPNHSLRDGMFKVLPIPESVASCLTKEGKAPGKTRRWFERILNRVKKVFSKNAKKAKLPKLGFNCFKEPNPGFEEKIRQVQRKLRSLSYEADIELNCRYLPSELVNQLPKSGLIGIKSPKGGGKSVTLKKIIAQAKKQGITVLSITPRIALGREQAIKWEITWIDDYGVMQTRAEDTTKQIQEVDQKRSEVKARLSELEAISYQQLSLFTENQKEDIEQQKNDLRAEIEQLVEQIENINAASIKTLALCWDSLWRTKDRDLKEALIVIDEAELGFKHFIGGSTCKRNRPYLLKVFKDKLTECLMSGGRVILSDADLTDLPLNYVRQILPIPIKPFLVKNEYIGDETRWVVDLRVGSRGNTLDEILEAARDGDYLAITTDSQAEAQALERRILQELSDEFCAFLDADGGITQEAQTREKALIVRIDRTTTETEAGKKFIQKPNEQSLHWKPRILIYTPSMGVGVSIDEDTQRWDEDKQEMVPYFDVVYGLFFGVLEPSQCRQQLARIRANVPRIVYCKESNKALEGCSSFFPEEVKRQTLKYNHSALNILDIAKGIAGYDADDEEIRETMLNLLHEAWDKDSRCWKEPSIDLDAAFKARENYGLWNLANLLKEELEDEGHTVVALAGMKTDLVEQMKDIKDELKTEEATLVAKSLTTSVEEAKKTINKLGATKDEHRSAQKTLLQEELPGVELTPEFIKKAVIDDRRRWLNQHKLFWYHTNTEAVKQIDTDHWLSHLRKFAEGIPFMRDIRSHAPKVDALRKSGVFEFIDLEDCERIYQGDTPEAQAFLKKCLRDKNTLQTSLNLLVTSKTQPIALANKILSKVGLGLEKLTKNKADKRYRLTADLINDPDRKKVLEAFELRWQKNQEDLAQKTEGKQAQDQTQQAPQHQGVVADYIYENPGTPYPCAVESQGGGEPLGGAGAVGVVCDTTQEEELVPALQYCESRRDFAAVVEGFKANPEQIKDAIALQDSQPRRQQLAAWHAALVNAANGTDSSPPLLQKPSIEVSSLPGELKASLASVETWGQFRAASAGYLPEEIQSAIDGQEDEAVRCRLLTWYEPEDSETAPKHHRSSHRVQELCDRASGGRKEALAIQSAQQVRQALSQPPSVEVEASVRQSVSQETLATQAVPDEPSSPCSTPKVFAVGQRLKGLRYSFAGKVAKVTEAFGDWCETTLGYVTMDEIDGGCWAFV